MERQPFSYYRLGTERLIPFIFAKRRFRLQFCERKGNGRLYEGTERLTHLPLLPNRLLVPRDRVILNDRSQKGLSLFGQLVVCRHPVCF